MEDRGLRPAIEREHQREHRAQLAEREDGDKRKRIHAADVGLAIGDIHRSPQQARARGSENAADCTAGVRAVA